MAKLHTLNTKALLEKNPGAAEAFARNQQILEKSGISLVRKKYDLGLPYAAPRLSTEDREIERALSE